MKEKDTNNTNEEQKEEQGEEQNKEAPEEEFSIQDYKKALLSARHQIDQLKLYNHKMAYFVRLLFNNFFSFQEKDDIANEIDSAKDEDEIINVYNKYEKRAKNKKGNFIYEDYTADFSKNLNNILKDVKGQDIFGLIKEDLHYLKNYFDIIDKLENENLSDQERETLENSIRDMNNQCKSSIKTIYDIIEDNDIQ